MKQVFNERRFAQKYDSTHVNGFINEEVDENYVDDMLGMDEKPQPRKVYKYDEVIIESPDMSRDNLVNGIIRLTYSESEEIAMIHHHLEDAAAYSDEWKAYNDVREKAKKEVDRWLEKDVNI